MREIDPHGKGAFQALAERHARIAQALERHGVPAPRRRPQGFATLARIVVGQQVSARAAATIWSRLENRLGGRVDAKTLLSWPEDDLADLGLSRQKRRYLRGIADAVTQGRIDLAALERQPDEVVIARLTALPGLGVWSAKMYLIFALRRPDVWPVEDLGVLTGLQRIFDLKARPEPSCAARLGVRFRRLRTSLALLCWHVLHNEPA